MGAGTGAKDEGKEKRTGLIGQGRGEGGTGEGSGRRGHGKMGHGLKVPKHEIFDGGFFAKIKLN